MWMLLVINLLTHIYNFNHYSYIKLQKRVIKDNLKIKVFQAVVVVAFGILIIPIQNFREWP